MKAGRLPLRWLLPGGLFLAGSLSCSGGADTVAVYAQKASSTAEDVKREVTREKVDCNKKIETPPVQGCLTGVLKCGMTVEGNTEGGESNWDDPFYANKFCLPSLDGHSGPERVYRLDLPAFTRAKVWLDSDCVDLDLVALAWSYDGTCPDIRHNIPECEADNNVGGDKIEMWAFKARTYLVGVDGKQGHIGPYSLTVQCDSITPEDQRRPWPHD